MKKRLSRPISMLLIATTALIAPAAIAQEGEASNETAPAAAGDSEQTDRIVVRGLFIPEPLQETSEVAAFLTVEDLERQGDSTAADALARLPGLSVAEGRFVYVRGLGERYSSAILNGSPLPSPEPLQRVVPLDLFPSSILGGVMVQKSYSPEFSGEFGGGVVSLSTLNLPNQSFLEAGVGFSVNTMSTLAKGYTHNGGDADVIGFDDGTRKIPIPFREAFAAGRRIDSTLDLYPELSNELEIMRVGQSLENAKLNLVQVNNDIPANGSLDLSAGYRQDFDAFSVGMVAVLGYANDWQINDGIKQEGRIDSGIMTPTSVYDYTTTDNKVGWDGLFGAGIELGEDHSLNWTNLWVRRTTKRTNRSFGFDELAGEQVLDERTAWYERELFSTQLDGDHSFGALDLGWRAAYAKTTRDAPYERQMRYLYDTEIERFLHDTSRGTNRWEFGTLEDEISSAGVDASYAIPMLNVRDLVVSGGVDYFDNTRSSESRAFRFVAEALPLGVQQSRPDFLFSDFNISPDRLVIRETTGASGAAAYDAQLEVLAGWLKADFEPLPYIRVSLGGRYEDATQSVTLRSLFVNEVAPASPPVREEQYFLPAATVTWNFQEDMQLRFGASQTIGRPQFRELAPQQYLDPDSDRLFIGNPYLTDTELLNYDARYEWFFADGQFLTLGAFLKEIDRPIESVVLEQGATVQQTYLNAPAAQIFGIEAEVRKVLSDPLPNMWFLGGKDIFFQSNYTWADSEVQVVGDPTNPVLEPGDDVVFPLSTAGAPAKAAFYVTDGTRLQGQSEHVVNLQLGWEDYDADSQGTLVLTYVSERSSARGRPGEPDLIQEPGVILDFVYRKEVETFGRPVTLKFKAANLLDEEYFEAQSAGGGQVIVNQYDLGRTFSFGVSTKF